MCGIFVSEARKVPMIIPTTIPEIYRELNGVKSGKESPDDGHNFDKRERRDSSLRVIPTHAQLHLNVMRVHLLLTINDRSLLDVH